KLFYGDAAVVAKAISEADAAEMKRELDSKGSYSLHTGRGLVEIRPEHVLISEFNASEGLKKFKYGYAKVDSEISKELEGEAFIRELERRIQMERKAEGLKRSDHVEVYISAEDDVAATIKKAMERFAKDVNAKRVELVAAIPESLNAVPLEIMDANLRVAIKKL
ncbi:DUF5915 domain-containing protein, partial [Candidatus Marsarchaeota archaeon]|nr:DUF5915 domain-containing protein [Candidatus Marsarchaeota archaeon]